MGHNRAGEMGTVPGRNNRFFTEGHGWFFSTREGAPIGPFNIRNEAEQGLTDFIEFISLAEPKTLSRFYASLKDAVEAVS